VFPWLITTESADRKILLMVVLVIDGEPGKNDELRQERKNLCGVQGADLHQAKMRRRGK
jgi:hypothetical protein